MSRLEGPLSWMAGENYETVGQGWMAPDWDSSDQNDLIIFRHRDDSGFTVRQYNPGNGEELRPVLAGPFESFEAAETAFWVLREGYAHS